MKKTNKECIAMLLAGGEGRRLAPLTSIIAKPAVPFGGDYRIIDFPLSNCANSGIDTVGVLTQYEAQSLHDHIGGGDAWSTDGNPMDITLLSSERTGEYTGTADAIYKNIEYIDALDPKDVLILSGDHIYHMDYNEMLQYHSENKARATIAVVEVPWEEASRFGVMSTDTEMNITKFSEKPAEPESNLASMGIYVFDWQYLRQHLIQDAKNAQSSHDFGKNIIPQMLADREKVVAYEFLGYWRDVGTINSLWEAHMDILQHSRQFELKNSAWPMFSADYNPLQDNDHAHAPDCSMVSCKASLEGNVERSVVFNGSTIGKQAEVSHSIIMPGAIIGKQARIEYAIVAEGAIVKDGAVVEGTPEQIAVVGPYETVYPKPSVRTQPARLLQEVYDKSGRVHAGGMSS
ncbi:glucose-1-phosphate adenylyltransferase [Paenibacillus hunanensis]|uniref:glucose-1-phosphate adenylyltransferase n=1 Tax=Paenibacillus hunanensis TaxID=539262 RepID=UPI002A6A320C|nr:glucose-1-phosphate adenylyltransferase [Paenibacillus hunanensis]WPP43364.1 glucose-1-phosphate adenylyltransferase [Paenibacillus hunanensis]